MKKIVILSCAIILSLSMVSCSKKSSEDSGKTVTNSLVVAEAGIANPDTQVNQDYSMPDKENFNQIPDEAGESFNHLIEVTKVKFPQESGKRMYGYTGIETVSTKDKTEDCYVFEIYNKDKETTYEVATVAVCVENDDVYVLNEESGEFELLVSETEESWSDTVTESLSQYLSDSTEEVEEVQETENTEISENAENEE